MTEHPLLYTTDMVRALLDGRKTQTRRVNKDIFTYSLTDDKIYGIHTDNNIKLKGYQNESEIQSNPNITEQRLYGWLGWADILTNEIQGFWEEGIRGLVSVKRRQYRKRIQEYIDVSQWQKKHKINSSFGMYGLSWNAIEKIYAGETFGWKPRKQQARESTMGNTRGELAGQKSTWQRKRGRKTPISKDEQYRMRTFEVGNQKWTVQPKTCIPCSRSIAMWNIVYSQYQIGMKIWVRETWRCTGGGDLRNIIYRAEGDSALSFCGIDDGRVGILHVPEPRWAEWDRLVYETNKGCDWRPSIHMPRWAARIFLEITGLRDERVQDISEEDAIAEGLKEYFWSDESAKLPQIAKDIAKGKRWWNHVIIKRGRKHSVWDCPRKAFRELWDDINAKRHNGIYAWSKNPECKVIEFKRL